MCSSSISSALDSLDQDLSEVMFFHICCRYTVGNFIITDFNSIIFQKGRAQPPTNIFIDTESLTWGWILFLAAGEWDDKNDVHWRSFRHDRCRRFQCSTNTKIAGSIVGRPAQITGPHIPCFEKWNRLESEWLPVVAWSLKNSSCNLILMSFQIVFLFDV